MTRLPLAFAPLLAACGTFDPIPDAYVQALRPDLYFTFRLPYQTVLANVSFTTAKPAGPTLPWNVEVITWSNEGGNIYDDTLGEALIETYTERENFLDWQGVAVAAPGGVFDQVGVELRTFLPVAAYDAPPLTGGFCEADVFGLGVHNCGEWIDAILQLWVQCKGDVGQLIDCHGLGYVVAPAILVLAISPPQAQVNMSDYFPYVQAPGLLLYRAPDGWRYKAVQGYPPREVIDVIESVGPFADAEAAVRDAAAKHDIPPHVVSAAASLRQSMPWLRAAAAADDRLAHAADGLVEAAAAIESVLVDATRESHVADTSDGDAEVRDRHGDPEQRAVPGE